MLARNKGATLITNTFGSGKDGIKILATDGTLPSGEYTCVYILAGTATPASAGASCGVDVKCLGEFSLAAGATISLTGYSTSGAGNGNDGSTSSSTDDGNTTHIGGGGSGGSHADASANAGYWGNVPAVCSRSEGGTNGGASKAAHGDIAISADLEPGSKGGTGASNCNAAYGAPGMGGGAIRVRAPLGHVKGTLAANGTNGTNGAGTSHGGTCPDSGSGDCCAYETTSGGGGGGGSGGSDKHQYNLAEYAGTHTATGGTGGAGVSWGCSAGGNGSNGSSGRIRLEHRQANTTPSCTPAASTSSFYRPLRRGHNPGIAYGVPLPVILPLC